MRACQLGNVIFPESLWFFSLSLKKGIFNWLSRMALMATMGGSHDQLQQKYYFKVKLNEATEVCFYEKVVTFTDWRGKGEPWSLNYYNFLGMESGFSQFDLLQKRTAKIVKEFNNRTTANGFQESKDLEKELNKWPKRVSIILAENEFCMFFFMNFQRDAQGKITKTWYKVRFLPYWTDMVETGRTNSYYGGDYELPKREKAIFPSGQNEHANAVSRELTGYCFVKLGSKWGEIISKLYTYQLMPGQIPRPLDATFKENVEPSHDQIREFQLSAYDIATDELKHEGQIVTELSRPVCYFLSDNGLRRLTIHISKPANAISPRTGSSSGTDANSRPSSSNAGANEDGAAAASVNAGRAFSLPPDIRNALQSNQKRPPLHAARQQKSLGAGGAAAAAAAAQFIETEAREDDEKGEQERMEEEEGEQEESSLDMEFIDDSHVHDDALPSKYYSHDHRVSLKPHHSDVCIFCVCVCVCLSRCR